MNPKTKGVASVLLYGLPVAAAPFAGALVMSGSLSLAKEARAAQFELNETEGDGGDFLTDSTSSINGAMGATFAANSTSNSVSTDSQTRFVPSTPAVGLGVTGAALANDYVTLIDPVYLSRRDKV